MSTPKSKPLTKSEVMNLLQLIVGYPVVFNKVTNATNNQLKAKAWREITEVFNESFANVPRKPEALRLKWENLKKAARKRTAALKNNKLKNEAGKQELIPSDDALDRVAAILDPTFQSLPATPQPVLPQPKSSKGKLKHQPSAGVITSQKRKNEAIAVYYEEKRKQEAEIFELSKRKLELEIRELEKKNYL